MDIWLRSLAFLIVIFIVYVDDGIFISGNDDSITWAIRDITESGLEMRIKVILPTMSTYLSRNTKMGATNSLREHLLIPSSMRLVSVILSLSLYQPNLPNCFIITRTSLLFSECGFSFGYQSVTGKVNYLTQTTRPDIMFAVHQIAKFSSDPRKEHGEAIIYLVRYLMKTRDLGLRFKPDPTVVLSATVTQTLQEIGTMILQCMSLALQSLEVDGWFSM
jgi:hypothetical protein